MAVYIVTGKLGSGKSLLAVSRIQEALWSGCRVATNMDIRLEHLVTGRKRRDLTRLPDWPTADSLEALGKGFEGKFDETKFGWIVLDEAATFLNSRDWAGSRDAETKEQRQAEAKERTRVINWFRHARKLRWHIVFITQDLESLDKQVRSALAEHVVECKRLDRIAVPLVSLLTKLLGFRPMTFPQIHLGVVKYGVQHSAPVVDRWVLLNGKQYHEAYDTQQKILGENDGTATMLDANHAGYLWEPSSLYDRFWALVGRSWGLPASVAMVRRVDFLLWDRYGDVVSAKPPVLSFEEWAKGAAAVALGKDSPPRAEAVHPEAALSQAA